MVALSRCFAPARPIVRAGLLQRSSDTTMVRGIGEGIRWALELVHALQGRQGPAPGSNRDSGGDGFTRTRTRSANTRTAESELPGTYKVFGTDFSMEHGLQ